MTDLTNRLDLLACRLDIEVTLADLAAMTEYEQSRFWERLGETLRLLAQARQRQAIRNAATLVAPPQPVPLAPATSADGQKPGEAAQATGDQPEGKPSEA